MAFLWIILLTLTPTLELRASIPYAMGVAHMGPVEAFLLGVTANFALAPLVWVFVDKVMHLFLRIGWIQRQYERVAERNVAKLQPQVDKYGILGLALFIGVPFPGTGVYSGCLAAWLLKFRFRDYLAASLLGCIIAGAAVTLVMVSGSHALHFFVKDL